jgi:hypothetical protein
MSPIYAEPNYCQASLGGLPVFCELEFGGLGEGSAADENLPNYALLPRLHRQAPVLIIDFLKGLPEVFVATCRLLIGT